MNLWAKNPDTQEWRYYALANGRTITLGGTFVETEGGYRQVSHHYTRRGNVIHLEIIEDGCGCDGRFTCYWRGQWTVGDPLERHRHGFMVPKFTETHAWQRDYYAEKASGDVDCVWDVEEPEGMNDAFDDRVHDFGVGYNRWTCG